MFARAWKTKLQPTSFQYAVYLPPSCCRWLPPALPLQEFNRSPDREKSMPTTFAAGRGKVTSLEVVVKEANVLEHHLSHKKGDRVARDIVFKISQKVFLGDNFGTWNLGFFAIDFILRSWVYMLWFGCAQIEGGWRTSIHWWSECQDMLCALTLERSHVWEAMAFALHNAEAAGEVCDYTGLATMCMFCRLFT